MPLIKSSEFPRSPLIGSSVSGKNPSTASVMIIDPIMSGKHIGASQLIEAGSQHLYETMTDACSVYQFNGYDYSCIIEMLNNGRGERK